MLILFSTIVLQLLILISESKTPFVNITNEITNMPISETDPVQWKTIVSSFPQRAKISYYFKNRQIQQDERVSFALPPHTTNCFNIRRKFDDPVTSFRFTAQHHMIA